MAFVHVADGGLQTHRPEHTDAANAKDDLLLDSQLVVAAVKAAGECAIRRRVGFDVRIEEIEGDFANIDSPNPGKDVPAMSVLKDQKLRFYLPESQVATK